MQEKARSTTGSGPVIDMRDLHKTYQGDGLSVQAVRGVTLRIEPGEFTALVGPSGSGKTTLLNLISGLDRPTSGSVRLNGVLLAEMSGRVLSDFRRDHIGFIFQAYNLIPVLTAAENVEYVLLLQRIPRDERVERVSAMLRQVGLAGYEDRLPSRLSGGQQQRVAIARAMVARPSLVLADEPTANVDSATGAGLIDMMHTLNRETGMTFLFSSHDPMVMERARRVITLQDGHLRDESSGSAAR